MQRRVVRNFECFMGEDDSYPLISNGSGPYKSEEPKTVDKLARKKLTLVKAAQYCVIFIILDVAKQVFTYATKYYNGGTYPLPQTQIVTWIEVLKLVFSLVSLLFFQSYGHSYRFRFSILFAIPALIYTLNNNLYLYALNYTTPPVWLMLIQSRVFLTALAYKFLFGKKLTRVQWSGLSLLVTSLCIVTFMNSGGSAVVPSSKTPLSPPPGDNIIHEDSLKINPPAEKLNHFDEAVLLGAANPEGGLPPLQDIIQGPGDKIQPQIDEALSPPQQENPSIVEESVAAKDEIKDEPKGFGTFKKSRSKRDADPSQFISPMPPGTSSSDKFKRFVPTTVPGLSLMAVLLSLLSATFSVTASIITEYFFKNDKRPFMEQQVQMYTFSSIISLLFCFVEPNTSFRRMFTLDISPLLDRAHAISPYTLLFLLIGTILLGALGGLAVAAIVKNLDNIVKIYCSSLGNMGTAMVSWMLFPDRFKLDAYYSGAVALLFAAIYLYESPSRK